MNYIIISLKHGTGDKPCFWRADAMGYTNYPFAAGIYTKEQVERDPHYYNDGINCIAVPLTEDALDALDFKVSYNDKKVNSFMSQQKRVLDSIRIK